MMSTDSWPEQMPYLTCDNYTGSNTPGRSLDLKSFFVDVPEPPTYGSFLFTNGLFNGYSTMQFDMDVLSVSVQNGIDYKERILGNWTAGFTTPLHIESNTSLAMHKPRRIYRVATVLVSFFIVFLIG